MYNYPTCDKNGICLYCGAHHASCWCGIKHVCLDCHQQVCKCERVEKKIVETMMIIKNKIAGNDNLCREIAELIVKELNLVPT